MRHERPVGGNKLIAVRGADRQEDPIKRIARRRLGRVLGEDVASVEGKQHDAMPKAVSSSECSVGGRSSDNLPSRHLIATSYTLITLTIRSCCPDRRTASMALP